MILGKMAGPNFPKSSCGASWGCIGRFLGRCWRHFGRLGEVLGGSWAVLGGDLCLTCRAFFNTGHFAIGFPTCLLRFFLYFLHCCYLSTVLYEKN